MQSLCLSLAVLLTVLAEAHGAQASTPTTLTISSSQVASFSAYTHFASAAYCPASELLTWTCGVDCLANADFEPFAAGGDGAFVQYWFVGYSPSLNTIIVAHEGTEPKDLVPLLTDAEFVQRHLDPILFFGADPAIMVHSGFADEHAKKAVSVLNAVRKAIERYGTEHVTLVGHSLRLAGGALALLDSVYLPLHLPDSVKFNTIAFGLPRVGNQAFADYVDRSVSLVRINNQKDIVPVIPPRWSSYGFQFRHPGGEMHIQPSGEWDLCLGQENESPLCSLGQVPRIEDGSIREHDGPYAGVWISREACGLSV